MANPNIPQGTVNRLRASVVWPGFPALNVTASYLGEEAIRLSFGSGATTFISTLTGAVTSPEPYVPMTLRMNLLKTQALANSYKSQMELSSLLGDGTIIPDASTLAPYQLTNCGIGTVDPLEFGGKSAGWIVEVHGYYIVNNSLWG